MGLKVSSGFYPEDKSNPKTTSVSQSGVRLGKSSVQSPVDVL